MEKKNSIVFATRLAKEIVKDFKGDLNPAGVEAALTLALAVFGESVEHSLCKEANTLQLGRLEKIDLEC